MPDDPAPTPKPKRRTSPALNQAQTKALSKAEQVGLAAQKEAYASALEDRDITGVSVAQLLTDVLACRSVSAAAMRHTTGKESATVDEKTAEKELMVALQEVQAAARQKYKISNPVMLQDYYIGVRLNTKRSSLEQYSQGIIGKLATDTLPGITAAKKAALTPLRTAYIGTNSAQGDEQSDAMTTRADRDGRIEAINAARATIQFAADAEWPFAIAANAGVRREFHLPPSQPFQG